MINVVKQLRETIVVNFGAPDQEIALADPLAYWSFPTARRLVSISGILETAPEISSFIVTITQGATLLATVTIAADAVTSTTVYSSYDIPANTGVKVVITQTGVAPDTGLNGSITIIIT